MATPVIAASGTYGYGSEYDGLVDWSRVGAVSVKGLSVQAWNGHDAPRMVETAAGVLNAVGLHNIGVDAFLTDRLPALRALQTRVIANCWGNTVQEYVSVAQKAGGADGVDVVELNLSCPHNPEWGRVLAADPTATAEVVSAVRASFEGRLWVKLSPNVADITDVARAAESAGADALTVGNTLRGMAVDLETKRSALGYPSGGLSGPAIKPVALFMVHAAAAAVSIPVIGCGGIASGRDAAEHLLVGASAVQVGTANLYDPAAPARIADELEVVLDDLGESLQALVGSLKE